MKGIIEIIKWVAIAIGIGAAVCVGDRVMDIVWPDKPIVVEYVIKSSGD